MSECKCDEIEIYEDYIETLTNASTKLSTCLNQYTNITQNLNSLAMYSAQAYDSNQTVRISDKLKGLSEDMREISTSFHQKILTKKNRLENDLIELKKEDTEFHAEEDKKLEAEKAAAANETVE